MMATQIIDRDMGERAIKRELRRLSKMAVTVGVHGVGETGKDERGANATVPERNDNLDLTMPVLAAFHEFGQGHNEERSFIRAGIDQGKRQLQKAYDLGYARILDGKGATQACDLLGVIAVGQIKDRIFDGIPPDLAPETKKRRDLSKVTGKRLRSNNATQTGYTPLVDTGQLVGSIAYQVDGGS